MGTSSTIAGWIAVVAIGLGHLIIASLLFFGEYGKQHGWLAEMVGLSVMIDYSLAIIFSACCWDENPIQSVGFSRFLAVLALAKASLTTVLSIIALLFFLQEPKEFILPESQTLLIILYITSILLGILFASILTFLLYTRNWTVPEVHVMKSRW